MITRTVSFLSFVLLFSSFHPGTSDLQALELSGLLTIEDVTDSFRVDFTKLDTPTCAIGIRRDTVNGPDMILVHTYGQYPLLFLLRAPYTPNLDSISINADRFFEAPTSRNVDSLRQKFLPIAASVNPECGQSGQCDTADGGIFVRTSENGVALWRPVGMYVGGIDRYYLFWAYSSDGTFSNGTKTQWKSDETRFIAAVSPVTQNYSLYDLQGKRLGRDAISITDKFQRKNRLLIVKNDITGKTGTFISFEGR